MDIARKEDIVEVSEDELEGDSDDEDERPVGGVGGKGKGKQNVDQLSSPSPQTLSTSSAPVSELLPSNTDITMDEEQEDTADKIAARVEENLLKAVEYVRSQRRAGMNLNQAQTPLNGMYF